MTFEPFIKRDEIKKQIKRLAAEIKRDYPNADPVFLCVLNGAFIFAADLFRACDMHDAEITFIRFKSYEGMASTGDVKEIMGLGEDIAGRHVIIVEDIIDSGLTMAHMIETLAAHNPASIAVCSCLVKPDALKVQIPIDYRCLDIPNDFIVGYGLDYDGFGRNTRDIYTLV